MTLSVEQQRELVDGILALRPETYLYSGLGGNVELIRSAYHGAFDGSAASYRAISQAAIDAVKRGQLQPNPRYVEAFQEAFSGDAAQKSGLGCNESILIEQLVARRLPCTFENISALISEFWESLADNPAHTQQQFVSDLRARRIAEMTNNGTTGFSVQVGPRKYAFDSQGRSFDYQRGMSQGGSLAAKGPWSAGQGGFDSMDDDAVATLYEQWRTTNDLKNMSVEELRKVVKSNGATDIFNKNVHAPDSVPDPQDRLYHPVTGEAFGLKSLVKYINEAPYNGRNLISRNGRVVPRLRQLFEQTIRGEFG